MASTTVGRPNAINSDAVGRRASVRRPEGVRATGYAPAQERASSAFNLIDQKLQLVEAHRRGGRAR